MAAAVELTLDDNPSETDIHFLSGRLAEYNRECVEDDHYQRLAVFLRDPNQVTVGGLLGETYWGWLHIDTLWVQDTLRHQGYGSRLLAAAEAEARRRGCHDAHLSTMSFQARAFYERRGYAVFGKLEDIPLGHCRYFMQKGL